MSSLRPAQLGPLVGHTTDQSACIWIRGGTDDEEVGLQHNRRTVGVITVIKEGGRQPRSKTAHYFRLRREFDRTGTFTLGEEIGLGARKRPPQPLRPDTEYVVRVGTLTVDDPNPHDESMASEELGKRLPDPKVWVDELKTLDPDRSEAAFRTFPDTPQDALSFMLGSCRYPGLLWQKRQSDTIFGPLLEEAAGRDGRNPARFALMVGDQIYADTFNRNVAIGRADTFAEFQERYHLAFGSKKMRRLLGNLPTYMILDDHEIEDNWTQDRIKRAEQRALFNIAINAYRSYQWIHGPRCFGHRLYYHFACGGFPFFVLDTRTQRFIDSVANDLSDNHLLGRPRLADDEPSQLDLLLQWLKDSKDRFNDRPKFIVTSSVFTPNPIAAREGRAGSHENQVKWKEDCDSWPAFPQTRSAILRCIVENQIQNVVFLSGDIHCANVAAMTFAGSKNAERLRAFSITSSAFYWPFPFADGDPSSFVHDSKTPGQEDTFTFQAAGTEHTMDYTSWNYTQEDNFCRVDVDWRNRKINITPFGSDGEVIEKGGWFGLGGTPIHSVLELA